MTKATITCLNCSRTLEVKYSKKDEEPVDCEPCRNGTVSHRRKMRLDHLKTLPIEERLSRIEEYIDVMSDGQEDDPSLMTSM